MSDFLATNPKTVQNATLSRNLGTTFIHIGSEPPSTGDVVPPLHLSSTFHQQLVGHPSGISDPNSFGKGYGYSRSGNSTRGAFERAIAAAESASHGVAYSSGCAAISAVTTSFLQAGDHVICVDDAYGGTRRLFSKILQPSLAITFSFIDFNDTELLQKTLEKHPNTRLLWLETPTNPTLQIMDIRKTADIANAHVDMNLLLCVDNTFCSPYCQNPLSLGADLVVHSVTKYINGHSDVVMGCVVTNAEPLYDSLRFTQNSVGAVPSPFDCYLALRGLKTLHVRMEASMKNAIAVAEFLEQHELVDKCIYPGLRSHPGHELATRQQSGYGAIVTFYVRGGLPEASAFLQNLKLFSLAESLGAVESLAESPALMTHASVPSDVKKSLGIENNLIRLSVGIEDCSDLIKDLDAGLKASINLA